MEKILPSWKYPENIKDRWNYKYPIWYLNFWLITITLLGPLYILPYICSLTLYLHMLMHMNIYTETLVSRYTIIKMLYAATVVVWDLVPYQYVFRYMLSILRRWSVWSLKCHYLQVCYGVLPISNGLWFIKRGKYVSIHQD